MVVYFDRVIFAVTAMMQYTIHVMSYEYIPPPLGYNPYDLFDTYKISYTVYICFK